MRAGGGGRSHRPRFATARQEKAQRQLLVRYDSYSNALVRRLFWDWDSAKNQPNRRVWLCIMWVMNDNGRRIQYVLYLREKEVMTICRVAFDRSPLACVGEKHIHVERSSYSYNICFECLSFFSKEHAYSKHTSPQIDNERKQQEAKPGTLKNQEKQSSAWTRPAM